MGAKPVARLGDNAFANADWHGDPDYPPVPVIGPISGGAIATNTYVNGRPMALKGATGNHRHCQGSNTFNITQGTSKTKCENKEIALLGHTSQHCSVGGYGQGRIVSASDSTFIGG